MPAAKMPGVVVRTTEHHGPSAFHHDYDCKIVGAFANMLEPTALKAVAKLVGKEMEDVRDSLLDGKAEFDDDDYTEVRHTILRPKSKEQLHVVLNSGSMEPGGDGLDEPKAFATKSAANAYAKKNVRSSYAFEKSMEEECGPYQAGNVRLTERTKCGLYDGTVSFEACIGDDVFVTFNFRWFVAQCSLPKAAVTSKRPTTSKPSAAVKKVQKKTTKATKTTTKSSQKPVTTTRQSSAVKTTKKPAKKGTEK
jgi:cell division septation protein DedD